MSATGVPFARLVRVEARKQVDTRAGRWLLGLVAGITVLVMVGGVWLLDPGSLTFGNLAAGAVLPQMLLLPVVGIMAATSEWSQRTAMVTFAVEPRRVRVVLAKLLSAVGVGLVVVVSALALAAVANVVGMLVRGGVGTWSLDWAVVGGSTAMQVLVVTQGVAFGLLVLNTPAAIAGYYVVPTVWTLVTSLVAPLRGSAAWLDPAVALAPLLAGDMHAADWPRSATTTAVWVVLPLLVGTWRVLRDDAR